MIIGLCGKKISGKSTVASMFEEHGFREISFADPLKNIAIEFGFTKDQVYYNKNEKNELWGICAREFLQTFGTEIGRDYLPTLLPNMKHVWIRLMEDTIQKNIGENIVISDCRFPDEIELVRKYGGSIVEIRRNKVEAKYSQHSSENSLYDLNPNYVIHNNGSLANLKKDVNCILQHLK